MATKSVKEHMGIRSSKYPMIPISKAISTILNEIESPTQICYARLNECGNRILAKDIYASINLPRVNTSIMDGYAMNYALNQQQSSVGSELGIYKVVNIVTAGNENKTPKDLAKGEVVYVTTGSALPSNTDCVIKIEDTEIIDENTIKILNPPKMKLQFVRTVGSDIKKGQLLLSKGIKLQACELGILASCGNIMVPVYNKIRVTILSTGDELKDPFSYQLNEEQKNHENESTKPSTNLIFDSNKIMIKELINESLRNLCIVKDAGIMEDDRDKMKKYMLEILQSTDILITSGGVSMGSRDYVKPILEEIGEVKFGRCCIKPGKPTTFATVMAPDSNNGDDKDVLKKKLVFGLPGNPVSTHVCFKMFVEPAIKKFTGVSSNFNCQHPPISVEITKDIRMDPERPNYNRCTVYWDKGKSRFIGYGTGSQRSSRLLSCKSANCLLRVPQKEGILEKGTIVKALVIGSLIPDMPPKIDENDEEKGSEHDHVHMMGCDCGKSHGSTSTNKHNERILREGLNINIGVLTVSDRASKGIYNDESGPSLINGLKQLFTEKCINNLDGKLVADESESIQKELNSWIENGYHLIITTGGTGFGKRDITPEVTKKLIHKECPGLVHKMMEYGLKKTEFACLSRYVAGITKNGTLIINMPGSVKAVKQCLDAIKAVLPHAVNQINSE